jgi:hypothetical protein
MKQELAYYHSLFKVNNIVYLFFHSLKKKLDTLV